MRWADCSEGKIFLLWLCFCQFVGTHRNSSFKKKKKKKKRKRFRKKILERNRYIIVKPKTKVIAMTAIAKYRFVICLSLSIFILAVVKKKVFLITHYYVRI